MQTLIIAFGFSLSSFTIKTLNDMVFLHCKFLRQKCHQLNNKFFDT